MPAKTIFLNNFSSEKKVQCRYTTITRNAQNVLITLPDGQLNGKIEMTKTNFIFYSFSGVRYAQPPIGNLRFKSPLPVQPWNGIYNATYEKNICYQAAGNNNNLENEDCLFLNIYSPKISNDLLPVMVYIHGGGFVIGFSGRLGHIGPDFFMEQNVVLVSINYRLGPFGFSSTNDMVIPGNAGLKDQTLALKWIQQNIKYFGGDPSKVTILGESAGSGSVSYHLLSRKSAGLFRAAILESGSALSAWAYQRDQREYTFRTASYINPNFRSNSSDELLAFLLNATAKDIHAASKIIYNLQTPGNMQLQQGFFYAPVLEPEHDDAFLTKSMFESYKNGDINRVPTIIGMNAEEAIGLFYSSSFQDVVNAFNDNEGLLLPQNMNIDDNNPDKKLVIKAIQDFYGISKTKTFKGQIPGTIRLCWRDGRLCWENSRRFSFHEALAMLEDDEIEAEAITLLPPVNACGNVTVEDSGDEDQVDINNLPASLMQTEVEIIIKNELPVKLQKNKRKK